MRTAVVVFPGTNCERDVVYALGVLGAQADLVWHRETDLSSFAGVILPGGFAHGDYLRTGAIARFSPVMESVKAMADEGRPVLGICNGFQVLCEAGMLPGALVANRDLSFICRPVHVRVESTDSILTRAAEVGDLLQLPLNSYEGNYVLPEADRVTLNTVLRYSDERGRVGDETNPNGSFESVAGVANRRGNVAGLMPHPERAVEDLLGSTDGQVLLASYLASLAPIHV